MKTHYVNYTLNPHRSPKRMPRMNCMVKSSQQPYFATLKWSFLVRIGHQIEMDFDIMKHGEITTPFSRM